MPRVIVTRPAREAAHWVRQLQAHGMVANALPLIAIGPDTDAAARQALREARSQLGQYRALMFVSGNAVAYFFESNWPLALDAKALSAIKIRAWAPGPSTSRALEQAGVPPDRIDGPAANAPQFEIGRASCRETV